MNALFRRTAVVAVLVALSGATACTGGDPTGTNAAASRPAMNGGVTFGSGGRAATSGTENTTAADSGSTARGGVTFGSGG